MLGRSTLMDDDNAKLHAAMSKLMDRFTRAGWVRSSVVSDDLRVDWTDKGKQGMMGFTMFLDLLGYDYTLEELQCLYMLRCEHISAPRDGAPPPCGSANLE